MKKYLSYLFTILIVISFLVFIIFKFNKEDNSNLEVIKVSEVTHSIFYAPFYIAIENGYFLDNGIEIELILTSGSDNVSISVMSKDTDVGLAGPESAMYAYNESDDYLQIFCGLTKRDGQFILSRNKSFKWEDLINKEILIGRSTGMPGLSFLEALENKGIDKDKVIINTSIDFSELSGSFIGGVGDFVNLFEPTASKLEKNNIGYVHVSVGANSKELPYTAFYSRKSFINNNKDLLYRFSSAINEGINYVYNNSELDIAKRIHNQFKDSSNYDLSIQIKRYKESNVWLESPYIDEYLYNNLNDLLIKYNLLNKKIDYNKIVVNLYEE